VSFAFWLVNSLGKERESEIHLPITIVNMPENVFIQGQSADEVRIKIRDKGTKLLSYSKINTHSLKIEVSEQFAESGTLKITPQQFRAQLVDILLPTSQIMEIKPDSISFKYQRLESKTLPIELVSNITLESQYIQTDKIEISPTSVTVFAPKSMLDTLKSIKTKLLTLHRLNKNTEKHCELALPAMLKSQVNEVTVNVKVGKFTEKTLLLPVKIINCPNDIIIKTFPSEVNAHFNIDISHYNSVNNSDISIEFDYRKINRNVSHQKLQTNTLLSYISNIQITPAEVEYIIEKKPVK
jgi:YbbR domain-containing protein